MFGTVTAWSPTTFDPSKPITPPPIRITESVSAFGALAEPPPDHLQDLKVDCVSVSTPSTCSPSKALIWLGVTSEQAGSGIGSGVAVSAGNGILAIVSDGGVAGNDFELGPPEAATTASTPTDNPRHNFIDRFTDGF